MPSATKQPLAELASVWLERELSTKTPPATLCVTGPLTNVAKLLIEHPECRSGIERIVVMGGCLGPLGPFRRFGNITPYAEFNFFMDPDAADYVLGSGLPVTLLPMDSTHELVFTEDRKRAALKQWNSSGKRLVQMLSSVENLDREKFDLQGAVIHDLHVFAYLAVPEFYQTFESGLKVLIDPTSEQRGRLLTCEDRPSVTVVGGILNPDRVFEEMVRTVANSLC